MYGSQYEEIHFEGARAARPARADVPHADDAERLPAELAAEEFEIIAPAIFLYRPIGSRACGAPARSSDRTRAPPPTTALLPGWFVTQTLNSLAASRSTRDGSDAERRCAR